MFRLPRLFRKVRNSEPPSVVVRVVESPYLYHPVVVREEYAAERKTIELSDLLTRLDYVSATPARDCDWHAA